MRQDFDPYSSQRDFIDAMSKMHHTNQQEAQRKLLEEQVRLQREANELKKKELAQGQERSKQERKHSARHAPSVSQEERERTIKRIEESRYATGREQDALGKLIRNAKKNDERRREEEKRFDEEIQMEIQKLRQEGKFTPTEEQERYWSHYGFPGASTSTQWDSEFPNQTEPDFQSGKQDEKQIAVYQKALSLFNAKEFDEAMDHCDTLLSTTPHAETFLLRAMIWANRQSYMNVVEDCTRAIAIDPTMQTAYWGRGTAFKYLIENSSRIKLEWRKAAIADFSKVHPDNPHFHEAKQAVLEMESGSYLFNMLIHQFVTYLTYPIHLLFGSR